MAKPILSDAVWELIEPVLPKPKRRRFRYPGRKPVGNRQALTGILFVLRTGIPWELLPQEMGCGSGMTCWRRLAEWQRLGIWKHIHEILLIRLQQADKICWDRASVDASLVRAVHGGAQTGPNPTDRAKSGSKHHTLVDGNGTPLVITHTAANVNEVTQIEALIDAIPAVSGKLGRPRRRPKALFADRGYDSDPVRARIRSRGIRPVIARRRTTHGSGMGVYRWVVERTFAWIRQSRRLRLRYERRPDIHQAFLHLAAIVICCNVLLG